MGEGFKLTDRPALHKLLLDTGFVVVRGAVDRASCVTALAQIREFKAGNRRIIAENLDDAGRMHRVVNMHLLSRDLASLFSHNRAIEVCDDFFGAETALYTSLLFERGTEQGLHRDSPHFVTRPEGKYLGVWVALENVDGENGPLVVVPGSHELPPIDLDGMARELYGEPRLAPANDPRGWTTYQTTVREMAVRAGLEAREVHVQAGDVIIWHPLLLHGGAVQRDRERTRSTLAMHVTPSGMPVYHQDVFFHAEKDVPSVAQWSYYVNGGRSIAEFNRLDFNRKYSVGISYLHQPGESVRRRLGVTARRLNRRMRHGVRVYPRAPTLGL